ncbi:MAG: hypothetical protein A2918_03750 [Candidatus Yanofskybacteria bacterium RIFCSPLOWO2_01_FULL_42_49]|uniref:Uncharacterized protein n=1 Tax=Candidatus Yanofskybacteria bacterium RIFCSPLOWO2_01_FULL_42_49 TaxID=1802694 RepID=A0A1F8GCM3_9BACT|nr:MAG: hypothetical protein A2918_03750 [Candidatus Yanofskybacteria bacterium RIFCSPLOWO2_01_FULL_42_49]
MATPTTPAAPVTPAPPTPTPSRPPRPGEMNFELRRLSEPLLLRQVAQDPLWARVKLVGFIIGSISVLVGMVVLGVWLGGGFAGSPVVSPTAPAAIVPAATPAPVVQQPTPVQPPVPGWQSRGFPTRDDCEYHSIVVLHEAPAGRCN